VRPVNSFPLMFALGLVALAGLGLFILWMPIPKPDVLPPKQDLAQAPTTVAWTPETIDEANKGDVVRGMVLARRCEKCHGEEGFSDTGEVPNLASMDKLAFWKELEDFRTGKRNSPLMGPVAQVLTAQDEADLGAYYAMLPAIPDPQDTRVKPPAALDAKTEHMASFLVTLGDGKRGIPPCQACHGPVGNVRGAPSLATQNADYIEDQLDNFADGSRANDINVTMRTIAHALTPEERKALGAYFGGGMGSSPGAARVK